MVFGETYGGQCPICGRGMLMRHDAPYAVPAVAYDACPWCGYACGQGWLREGTTEMHYGVLPAAHVWRGIYARHQAQSREGLLRAHPTWTEFCQPDGFGPWPRTYVVAEVASPVDAPVYTREWLAENPAEEGPKVRPIPPRRGAGRRPRPVMDDQPIPQPPATVYGLPEHLVRIMLDRFGAGD